MSGQQTALFKSDGESFSEFGQKNRAPDVTRTLWKKQLFGAIFGLFMLCTSSAKGGQGNVPLSVILSNSRFRAQKSAYSQRLKIGAW